MAREINLVPDIKTDMIKALKLRNLIFFLCIVVAAASVGVTVVTGLTMVGQQAVVDGKTGTIKNLSDKLNSYSDLKDFLTIRDQLSDVDSLTKDKKVLSRTFNILRAIIPSGADTIKISKLDVNLTSDAPTFSFDAQANAGEDPFIDFNVLDAFKKSMEYMRYDYGSYVDENGDTIPSYCIIESGSDGSALVDQRGNYYGLWTIEEEGCKPAKSYKADEEYNGDNVVRIWRTPQFTTWYKENPSDDEPSMTLSGEITNVPHFESACTTYTGYDDPNYSPESDENLIMKADGITWVSTNKECLLVPDGIEGINAHDRSNGKGEDGELVLRFSATITFAPEVFQFANTHMRAVAPGTRRNVTDSFVQIQSMFAERAADCDANDADCNNAKTGDDDQSSNSNNNNINNNSNNSGNNGGSLERSR